MQTWITEGEEPISRGRWDDHVAIFIALYTNKCSHAIPFLSHERKFFFILGFSIEPDDYQNSEFLLASETEK